MEQKYLNPDIFIDQFKTTIINKIDDRIKDLKKKDFIDIVNEIDNYGDIDPKYYKAGNKLIRDIKVKDYKEMIKINSNRFINDIIREFVISIEYKINERYNNIDIITIDIEKVINEFIYYYVSMTYSDMIYRDFNDYCSMYYDLPYFWSPDNMFMDFNDNILDNDIFYDLSVLSLNGTKNKYVNVTGISQLNISRLSDGETWGNISGYIDQYNDTIICNVRDIIELSKRYYIDVKLTDNKDKVYEIRKYY